MDAYQVGLRLKELLDAGETRTAIEELYADNAVSIEAMDGGPRGRVISGKETILEASDEFFQMMEVHGGEMGEIYPHDDAFICYMSLDVTPKMGPMEGNRFEMKEMAHYTVADGKITQAKFFYHMPGEC